MKKTLTLFIIVSMICVSISGAAVSVKQINNENTTNDEYHINLPTESFEVNTNLLKNINKDVDKYLNFEEYYTGNTPRNTPKEIEYPWIGDPLAAGDFVEWIIHVNFNDKHFEREIDINPNNFKDRFLDHPWHYEACYFDVDEDGVDDLEVYYSIFNSMLTNIPEGIDIGSIRTCLKVDTADILDRTAKLEVWSQIKFNYGLITVSKSYDRSLPFNGKFIDFLTKLAETIKNRFENSRFTLLNNLIESILNICQKNTVEDENEPIVDVLANDDDWLAIGIGVSSPEGENIPTYFEKLFNIAKDKIFSPLIFETELKDVRSRDPLALLFGFQAFTAGSNNPELDVAFSIEFDPAIYIRIQFIPRDGYIYYGYDSGSGHGTETNVTFTARFIEGVGENVELTLIFDNTYPIAQSDNWMSFELTASPIGFLYKANKRHNIGLLVTSPIFSAKIKLVSIPSSVKLYLDADLSLQYQQGQLLNAEATGSINLDMSSDLDDIILYYPKLSSDFPDVEFIRVSDIPKKQSLSANIHLYIKNESMTTILGEGYVDFTMSSNLGSTKVFYPKAEPTDPDKLFLEIPSIPSSQRIGTEGKLYIDLDDFTNDANYIFGKVYRDASGNIPGIHAYLPGDPEPVISITDIPADATAEAKLEWNKLKGYALANRQSAGNPDPIEVNIDIGTFNLYNYFEIRDGHIKLDAHLAENGYFKFDTSNDMIADTFRVTDTSSGNQLEIGADNVNANDIEAKWILDISEQPIQVEQLKFSGELSLLDNFHIEATYQGKYLSFETDWHMGEEGEFSLDFNQDEPIEIIIDDLFENSTTWDVGGGVVISQDFHFDVKWDWKTGEWGDRGEFKINEDTNDPNFDYIFLKIQYTPDGYSDPQYGIELGGTDISLIVYLEWWDKGETLPAVWWYVYIAGNFYLDLLWKGTWHENVHTW